MGEYMTRDFIATQDANTLAVELWVDWIPSIDGNPSSSIDAKMDGADLLVFSADGDDPDKKTRRVVGLDPDVIELLAHGLVWRVCGPSGVLGEHRVHIQDS